MNEIIAKIWVLSTDKRGSSKDELNAIFLKGSSFGSLKSICPCLVANEFDNLLKFKTKKAAMDSAIRKQCGLHPRKLTITID